MAAVYLNRLGVFMSDVYSVEEPAGLALPLWFTPAHFGLQELAKEKNRLCCCHLQTSGSTQVVLTRDLQTDETFLSHLSHLLCFIQVLCLWTEESVP